MNKKAPQRAIQQMTTRATRLIVPLLAKSYK